MLIRPTELDAIRVGRVDLAFRRWERPRLRVGTLMRTRVGLVEVLSVDETGEAEISDDDARRAGSADRAALLAELAGRPDRPIFRVGVRWAGADPRIALRDDADLDDDQRADLGAWLDRLDAASRHGPWTRRTLEIIAARPAVRATDLATEMGLETMVFKRNVRKLKERGLTESLDVGYRLAPRGRALLGHCG